HETAMDDLLALKSNTYSTPQEKKRFYFLLSSIVRMYLEAQFGIPASDRTTEELKTELDKVSITGSRGAPSMGEAHGATPSNRFAVGNSFKSTSGVTALAIEAAKVTPPDLSPGKFIDSAAKTLLVNLLSAADQVKFTDFEPSTDILNESLQSAIDFVKITSSEISSNDLSRESQQQSVL
ncbi:MAG: hypothetical protein KDD48_07875, partial [Bdellovibrionales bacterium]|nr:hypothetical protein [Bdellovibrionales bacterium]